MPQMSVPAGVNFVFGKDGTLYVANAQGFINPAQGNVAALLEAGFIPQLGLDNLAATTDPGVSNDSSQGYQPGSFWFNTTTKRVWIAQTVAVGAAVWVFDGVQPGVGVVPSSMLTQFGASAANFLEEGNVNRQISSAGVSPGATGADNVLAVYSLPASAFDILGRGLCITAQGSFGATANTKRLKIIFNPFSTDAASTVGAGGVTIADSGAVVTNAGGWSLQ